LVQPGEHHQLLTRLDAVQRACVPLVDLDPGIRGALTSLPGRILARGQRRADDAHRLEREPVLLRHAGILPCR